MTLERVVGALIFAMGAAYFAGTCYGAPGTRGASLIFGVLVGGVLCFVGISLWRDEDA